MYDADAIGAAFSVVIMCVLVAAFFWGRDDDRYVR